MWIPGLLNPLLSWWPPFCISCRAWAQSCHIVKRSEDQISLASAFDLAGINLQVIIVCFFNCVCNHLSVFARRPPGFVLEPQKQQWKLQSWLQHSPIEARSVVEDNQTVEPRKFSLDYFLISLFFVCHFCLSPPRRPGPGRTPHTTPLGLRLWALWGGGCDTVGLLPMWVWCSLCSHTNISRAGMNTK